MPKTASDTQRVSTQVCAVEDCASPAMARGFCGKHYQRRRTHGDPLKVASPGRPRVTLPCKMDGCEGEHYARGLCRKHYQRLRTHGDPFKVAKPQTAESPLCVVDGCEGEHASRGFCGKHYNRWRRHGDPSIKSKPRRAPARPLCRVDLGSRIKAARVAAGLTQRAVAGRASVCVMTVSLVERGHRTYPRHSTLKGFADALDIPLSGLLARPADAPQGRDSPT